MAIRLSVYLKRTSQTLVEWMRANDIDDPKKLVARAAYLGFSAGHEDVREAEALGVQPSSKPPVTAVMEAPEVPVPSETPVDATPPATEAPRPRRRRSEPKPEGDGPGQ